MLYEDKMFAQNWIEQFRTDLAEDEEDGDTPALVFVREHRSEAIIDAFLWNATREGQEIWSERYRCSDLMMR